MATPTTTPTPVHDLVWAMREEMRVIRSMRESAGDALQSRDCARVRGVLGSIDTGLLGCLDRMQDAMDAATDGRD